MAMAKYKYTKPPWRAKKYDRPWGKEFAILGNDGSTVAILKDDERVKDNARVLANAPYSLEACRDIYQIIRAVGKSRAKRATGLPEKWWDHLSSLERVAAIYAKRALDKMQEQEFEKSP